MLSLAHSLYVCRWIFCDVPLTQAHIPEGDENSNSSGAEEGSEQGPRVNAGASRTRGESAEERRARKARVKAERRDKRTQKAVTKAVFREEGKVVSRTLGNPETAQRRSVFGYN